MFKYGVNSGPYFPAFGLNTERYEVSLRILSECRKIRTRNNSVFGHFSRTAKIGWKQFSVSFPSRNEFGNSNQNLRKEQFSTLIKIFLAFCFWPHYVKYARIRVSSGPYFPVWVRENSCYSIFYVVPYILSRAVQ